MKIILFLTAILVTVAASAADSPVSNQPLRIICFGAHPDDCELQAGGVAMMWSARGDKVKLVSTTNGDIGHWRDNRKTLARRRKAEVEASAKVLGVEVEVMDIHDGELMPTLENRRKITRLIREWEADIVMSPRPNDYHPDHRYTAVLVQDSAYMVAVPFFCPETPALKKNPIFMYYPDRFQKPTPFEPDVVISIDSVVDRKLDALELLVSQFYEGGALGSAKLLPSDPAGQRERERAVRESLARRYTSLADRFRGKLAEWYPAEKTATIRSVEAFELCEYGRQPDKAELRRFFPFDESKR